MSLSSGQSTLATDINNLKAKVKKEMLRRDGRGSLVSYGGSNYDYNVVPVAGGDMLTEHANKIIIPLNQVKASGFNNVAIGDPTKSLEVLDGLVTAYAAEHMTSSNSSCSSSCSGLCTTGSAGSCTCSGSCGGECSVSADGSCTCGSACKGSTAQTCTCGSACGGQCGDGCTSSCSLNCSAACTGFCKNKGMAENT